MSELISHFRISSDLFDLANFGTNNGLQMANATVTRRLCVTSHTGGEALS